MVTTGHIRCTRCPVILGLSLALPASFFQFWNLSIMVQGN